MSKHPVSVFALLGICALGSAQQLTSRAQLNDLLSGGYEYTDAFEAYQQPSGQAVWTNTTTLNNTMTINGQGPGLTDPGVTYSTDPTGNDSMNSLQWNGVNYYGTTSENILAGTQGLELTYTLPVNAMGVDLSDFTGYSDVYTAYFYNGATLLGTVTGSISGPTPTFLGWQNGSGITNVLLVDSVNDWSPIIDNHSYGYSSAVPEPATLSGLALVGLSLIRRRRNK